MTNLFGLVYDILILKEFGSFFFTNLDGNLYLFKRIWKSYGKNLCLFE